MQGKKQYLSGLSLNKKVLETVLNLFTISCNLFLYQGTSCVQRSHNNLSRTVFYTVYLYIYMTKNCIHFTSSSFISKK